MRRYDRNDRRGLKESERSFAFARVRTACLANSVSSSLPERIPSASEPHSPPTAAGALIVQENPRSSASHPSPRLSSYAFPHQSSLCSHRSAPSTPHNLPSLKLVALPPRSLSPAEHRHASGLRERGCGGSKPTRCRWPTFARTSSRSARRNSDARAITWHLDLS